MFKREREIEGWKKGRREKKGKEKRERENTFNEITFPIEQD